MGRYIHSIANAPDLQQASTPSLIHPLPRLTASHELLSFFVGNLAAFRAMTCGVPMIRLVANLLLEAGPACLIRGLDAVEPILIAAGSISEP